MLIACAGIIITITRPDGSKTTIEVEGNAKVEVAADNSRPKAAAGGTIGERQSVAGGHGSRVKASRVSEPKPPFATAKPIYETDFLTRDPNWLSPPNDGTPEIRDGHLVLHSNESTGAKAWTRGANSVPWMNQADIEIAGRATSGMWGTYVLNGQAGIVLAIDQRGEVRVAGYEGNRVQSLF